MKRYHDAKLADPAAVPHILGLTATPVLRSKASELP